jgi:hypothetical protein
MGHCIFCGSTHEGKFCPPSSFGVIVCKNCKNEVLMPYDAISLSMDCVCGNCEQISWNIRPATIDDLMKSNPDYGKYCTNIRSFDLKKVNSATKYPSILTYHALGDRGSLKDEVLVSFESVEEIFVSEKIDGVNSRIILFPKDMYVIGSREELLHAYGDIIFNPVHDIVETVRTIADNARRMLHDELEQRVYVLFGETYGGKATKSAKQYTKTGNLGFRLFDVMIMGAKEFEELLDLPLDKIASWRDNGGQKFVTKDEIEKIAKRIYCDLVPSIPAYNPPKSVEKTYGWLKYILPGSTFASLDKGLEGKPEGVVARTADRSKIAKIRFEDYERTIKK